MSRFSENFDAVVIGGGPAGAATARELAALGLTVLVVEREIFPRYHIGESLTGTAGDYLQAIGLAGAMERLGFPTKPGVKVIGHDAQSEFYVPVLRPTWQVRRAEFDQLLLEEAQKQGAVHRRGSVRRVLRDGERVAGVAYVTPDDESTSVEIGCRVLVDASGQSTLLSSQGIAGARRVEAFNRQIAVYAQYQGVERDDGDLENATVIFYAQPLHWAWLIPLSATTVSIGIVLPAQTYKRHGASPESVLGWGLDSLNPDLRRRMRGAERTEPVRVTRNYSYRVEPFTGDGWLCVGDAHRFTDPIFSFGVSFALTGARAASAAIVEALGGGDERALYARYAAYCTRGHDTAAELIRYFWKFPAFFSFLTRGRRGQDIVRLLAGDCFEEVPLEASLAMRQSLRSTPALERLEGRARAIGERVYARYDLFQGVEAAYIAPDPRGIRLSFLLSDDDIDLYDSLHDFEEQLVADVGRAELAIASFTPSMADALPSFDDAIAIFDRRATA